MDTSGPSGWSSSAEGKLSNKYAYSPVTWVSSLGCSNWNKSDTPAGCPGTESPWLPNYWKAKGITLTCSPVRRPSAQSCSCPPTMAALYSATKQMKAWSLEGSIWLDVHQYLRGGKNNENEHKDLLKYQREEEIYECRRTETWDSP